jgi:hypothetical protein
VRRACWGLQGHEPVDYEQAMFGRTTRRCWRRRARASPRPRKLVRPGRRRPGAPEASVDQLGLVVESLQRLHPGSRGWRRR